MREDEAMTKVDEHASVPRVGAAERHKLADALDREGVVAASLFGSQATGLIGPLSDVDIAIWVDPELDPKQRLTLRSELSRAATAALGTDEVDLVLLNDAPPLFKHRAMSGAVRLIERDPVDRVRLETAALLEYFDTAPLRKELSTARRRRIAEGRFGRR
jgi:predicted nucleotidyltransferase